MSLYNDIVNIREGEGHSIGYLIGHKVARHAAAELALKYERALEMAMFALNDIAEFGRVTSDDCSEYCADHLDRVRKILEE